MEKLCNLFDSICGFLGREERAAEEGLAFAHQMSIALNTNVPSVGQGSGWGELKVIAADPRQECFIVFIIIYNLLSLPLFIQLLISRHCSSLLVSAPSLGWRSSRSTRDTNHDRGKRHLISFSLLFCSLLLFSWLAVLSQLIFMNSTF